MLAGTDADQKVDGSKLWAETCQSCHNRPKPASYSNAQWDVIIHHMRVRANLTGPEARSVLEFIKDSK
jgi:cytochrome c5